MNANQQGLGCAFARTQKWARICEVSWLAWPRHITVILLRGNHLKFQTEITDKCPACARLSSFSTVLRVELTICNAAWARALTVLENGKMFEQQKDQKAERAIKANSPTHHKLSFYLAFDRIKTSAQHG